MASAPTLLDEQGNASIATALMSSHHAFRRDLGLFAIALGRLDPDDQARAGVLREEWGRFHGTLHGHHQAEDQNMFPSMQKAHPALVPVIAGLSADHRRIDPLLEEGDRAFGALPSREGALAVVTELQSLLVPHLATEEEHIVPLLRGAREFPPPASEEELKMYAEGFAWSSHGLAPQVLEKLHAMLPPALLARLPAARAAFAQRCERVWGSARTGASTTAIPDWLSGAGSG